MTQRIYAALAKVNPRVLAASLVCVFLFLAFEAWVLVLAKPVAQYRQLAANRASLAASLEGSANPQNELGRLADELKLLAGRLTGETRAAGSDDQMSALLMSELDRSAARSRVAFTGVKPGARRQVLSFEEIAFDISAQGKYLMLCEWLLDFENALGQNATVTEFLMQSADEGRQVSATLKAALYRPLPATGASK